MNSRQTRRQVERDNQHHHQASKLGLEHLSVTHLLYSLFTLETEFCIFVFSPLSSDLLRRSTENNFLSLGIEPL